MTTAASQPSTYTVLVTGVGAIIGQGIVKALRRSGRNIRIVGIDRNGDSLGPFLCDRFHAKPACAEDSEAYLAFWRDLLAREAVDLVLPGLEPDLYFLNANREPLQESGAVLGLNNPSLIALTRDKWLLGQELGKAGLVPIPTLTGEDWHTCVKVLGPPPLLLKPRQGSGSRGIVRVEDEEEYLFWTSRSPTGLMAQQIVGNDEEEFTAGAFGLGQGLSLDPIVFRRKLSASGSTQFAEVVNNPPITAAVHRLAAYFRPIGPTNYQFRTAQDVPYLLEINPRMSSSSSLRAGFGYNEADMALTYYLEGKAPEMPAIRAGRAWRYSEDYFSP